MKYCIRKRLLSAIAISASLIMSPFASAHFMVAQHGTLNFVDDSVFMVLSLPMSAFELMDEDGNGAISMVEFNKQRITIVASIRENVTLGDEFGSRELLGLMLSPELDHESTEENISQVVVMGKFDVGELQGKLRFKANLFGVTSEEQSLKISAKRKADNLVQELVLTPDNASISLMIALAG